MDHASTMTRDIPTYSIAGQSGAWYQAIQLCQRNAGAGLKPRVVLSGVNLADMGPLMVFRDALASLAEEYSDKYEIIALVHRKSLFDIPGVTFIEYPEIKSSWLKRLRFEYYDCRRISEEIKPHLWFSMHDMTPNVRADIRAVYCHNACPFYRFRMKEALLDWKFGLFTLLYRYLYGINIKSNDFVVVQQDWMRSEFRLRYGVRNIVVAHPSVKHLAAAMDDDAQTYPKHPYRFFYPAYPRTFKNIEQILKAARILQSRGFNQFEVWLTMDGTETRYASSIASEFSDLTTVKWLGLLPRDEVMRLYAKADCLIFPSKLETWGMPITEFKATGKPILAADLPYAHETIGEYGQVAFFRIGGDAQLAAMMKQAAMGEAVFRPTVERDIAPPFSRNWEELWKVLLSTKEART
jgi:glycosyltransferase involved in cell wall biosynthesis